nr:hypothetical protein Iba_chr08bCG9880 [Ipomoea batatas]
MEFTNPIKKNNGKPASQVGQPSERGIDDTAGEWTSVAAEISHWRGCTAGSSLLLKPSAATVDRIARNSLKALFGASLLHHQEISTWDPLSLSSLKLLEFFAGNTVGRESPVSEFKAVESLFSSALVLYQLAFSFAVGLYAEACFSTVESLLPLKGKETLLIMSYGGNLSWYCDFPGYSRDVAEV